MYNGIINVYKEKGFTSHDVVAVLRGILGQKKIGHTGTLDPEATGVLPVCVGKGTKVAGMLTDKDKVYRTTFVLGTETDTQDHTGDVIEEKPFAHVSEQKVLDAIEAFTGDLKQVPPMYSALKVNGRKLYDLAREGKTVERKERDVTIHSIDNVLIDLPYIHMTVHCSKGTYIRTLCRDIAEYLGTCGHMTELERLSTGIFHIEQAKTLDDIKALKSKGIINDYIVPVDALFDYEKVVVREQFYKMLYNGNKLPLEALKKREKWLDKTSLNVYNEEGAYMGIYEWSASKDRLVPIKFFDLRQ